MKQIYADASLTLYQGEAADYPGPAPDLILTNPYGPMGLRATPALLHQWVHRQGELERWTGRQDLQLVGTWNDGREAFWASGMAARPVDLSDLRPEPGGWYPEALVNRLLAAYAPAIGSTVWDGFMGRGTVAQVARARGLRYIGIERLAAHLRLAQAYLGLADLPLEG